MPTPLLTSVLLILVNLSVLILIGWIVVRSLRTRLRNATTATETHPTGPSNLIPVLATFTGIKGLTPWLAIATNSLNPVFAIGPDYLEYRVLKRRLVPLSHIQSVRMMKTIGTVNLHFIFKTGPFTFTANVGDETRARSLMEQIEASIQSEQ